MLATIINVALVLLGSLLGLIFQRNWAETIYPWLERNHWVDPVNNLLVTISEPFEPWIQWSMDPVKFPINSYEIFFISMVLAVGSYIIGSLLTYKPYDLDKLLHRGKYCDNPEEALAEEKVRWTPVTIFRKLIGITPEYTRGDKVIAWSVFCYVFIYQLFLSFVVVAIWNIFWPWPKSWWNNYFYIVSLVMPGIIGVVSTFWFLIGGARDTFRLFRDLSKRVENPDDNGQISVVDSKAE